jgi:hypothetical protein
MKRPSLINTFSICAVFAISVAALVQGHAAAPAPPSGAYAPGLTITPSTNAVVAPQGFFPVALVYSPTNLFSPSYATAFQWTPTTDTTVTNYNIYYGGMASTNAFNKVSVPTTVTAATFLNLNTNLVYGIYCTAVNPSGESGPSTLVVLVP